MAEQQLTCAECGSQFKFDVVTARPKYCGAECKAKRKRRRSKPKAPIVSLTYECWWCGKKYHPKRREANKACSRECGFKVKGFIRSARTTRLVVSVRTKRRRCDQCGEAYSQRANELTCSVQCAEHRLCRLKAEASQLSDEMICRECHSPYKPTSSGGRPSLYCSDECRETVLRRSRRISSLLRERRLRCGNRRDRVDPISVFERDGWRCGICGLKTDKAKRGTYHPKAPELDHIVALANGGTHTWDNVQCSCRACNGSKGATNYGQMLLFPAP